MREINICEIEGLRIGQVEDAEAATGCTALVFERGAAAGLDVRGGGPASRETELLSPRAAAAGIHALVLGGGSAFGLDAAGGVMQSLEERGIGYDTGFALVPLVCQSDIYDLSVASAKTRPDKRMGYAAAEKAFEGDSGNYRDGNYGAGCGASVGKLRGMDFAMKSGIGSYAVQIGDLKVGALMVVNALGDVYDVKSGKKAAGLLSEDKKGFRPSEETMYESYAVIENKFTGNTTIGALITNAAFSKAELGKLSAMAGIGMVRAIRPINTSADGDSIYAISLPAADASGRALAADLDTVGTLAAEVVAEAILRAVNAAEPAYGLKAASSLREDR